MALSHLHELKSEMASSSLTDLKLDGVDVKEARFDNQDDRSESSCTNLARSSPDPAGSHDTAERVAKREGIAKDAKRNHDFRDKWVMFLTVLALMTGIVCLLQLQTFSKFAAKRQSPLRAGNNVQDNPTQHRKTKVKKKPERNPKKIIKNIIEEAFPDPTTTVQKTFWDVNGPPVALPESETMQSSKRKRKKEQQEPMPTRRGPGGKSEKRAARSEPILEDPPAAKDVPGSKHASESLQCRESVINFVINATDGKDECDGLIKAFDKTCSEAGEVPGPGRYRRWLEEHQHRKHKRTRRIGAKLFVPISVRVQVLLYQTLHLLERLARFTIGGYEDKLFFFAEDEVLKSWDDAKYLVDNHLDGFVLKDARSFMHDQQCTLYERIDLEERIKFHRQLEELPSNEAAVQEHGDVAESSADKAAMTATTAATMKLPIKSQHASEKIVNDALLLQQGDKIFKAANESIIAMEEAEKSRKSITEATDAVNHLLNDPTSVEARTCCASILNVYHELCSTDEEEQVSDTRLFFLVLVMALCGMIKSLIRHFKLLWLPEAAGCILVGGGSSLWLVLLYSISAHFSLVSFA